MIGKFYKYRGYELPWTTAQGRAKMWYPDVKIDPPITSINTQVQRLDYHGVYLAPTLMQGRVIQISGQIFDTEKENRGIARNEIREIFSIPDFPTRENEINKLEFTDDDGTEWFINCKVQSLPSFDHLERGGPQIDFFLTLIAEDGYIYSKELNSVEGVYGLYGGWQLPVELPDAMDLAINYVDVEVEGTQKSPLKITATGDIRNPKFLNLNNGTYYAFDNLTLTAGKTLVIDPEDFSAKVNGDNVLGLRRQGSTILFLDPGINRIVMIGDNYSFANPNKASFIGEYRNIKI